MKKRAGLIVIGLLSMATVLGAADDSPVNPDLAASVEERRILVSIEEQYAKLDDREAEINSRELQLKTLESEVDKKLAALTEKRDELSKKLEDLSKLLEQVRDVEDERVAELSLIYEKMNPQRAALLVAELDQDLAVKLLLGIKKKVAGKILNSLDPETATELSKAFTEIEVP